MTQPLWRPSPSRDAALSRFADRVGLAHDALHGFSIEQPEAFWSAVWDFCGVVGDKGGPPHIENGDKMPGAAFFPRASLNFAENLLARAPDEALVFWGEDKARMRWSRAELTDHVAGLRQRLINAGVGPGDRVAGMVPNMPQTLAAMLAAASIGAVWSSCSPDFGVQGVLDRFGQIEPKAFIVCDGYYYGGKTIDVGDKAEAIARALPTLNACAVINYIGAAEALAARLPGGATWDAAAATPNGGLEFTRLPFSHPLYILYSSGTTGAPKCIVHSAGGVLLQHLKEHQLHCDVRPGDRMFYFSTCGWMMWNWLVSGLASGATLLLFDGSPTHPTANVLFDYADAEGMTHFGTSAKYIDALKKQGLRPRDTHSLATVRMIASTGSPLVPESFDYVYENIKSDVHLASVSGGTDICSCFVIGNPLLPVWRGEIQGPGLGLAVDVVNEAGEPIRSGKGELVCRQPFPAMPIGFWNDPDGLKYRGAYFERFDNIWHHGDFAEWTEHGGIIIHGRSDATLNPGGVRIGTAEIYRQVEQLPEVKESIVIGQDWDNDVRVVLFVVLRDGLTLDETLRASIKRRIREGASPRHVPAVIVQVPDIPRTKSGKITEIAVRDIISGREVKNKEALANPEALDHFRALPELTA
ncbi:MAG: acetoacetate--CoA ligase [Hyphomicrobiales bacterium]|nr:acetoacetate--CoA ligase [Hyphomicrobiales bacterium]